MTQYLLKQATWLLRKFRWYHVMYIFQSFKLSTFKTGPNHFFTNLYRVSIHGWSSHFTGHYIRLEVLKQHFFLNGHGINQSKRELYIYCYHLFWWNRKCLVHHWPEVDPRKIRNNCFGTFRTPWNEKLICVNSCALQRKK